MGDERAAGSSKPGLTDQVLDDPRETLHPIARLLEFCRHEPTNDRDDRPSPTAEKNFYDAPGRAVVELPVVRGGVVPGLYQAECVVLFRPVGRRKNPRS